VLILSASRRRRGAAAGRAFESIETELDERHLDRSRSGRGPRTPPTIQCRSAVTSTRSLLLAAGKLVTDRLRHVRNIMYDLTTSASVSNL